MSLINPYKLLSEIKETKKRVLVVGLGISGLEMLKFLARNRIQAIGIDCTTTEQFERSNKFPREFEEVRKSDLRLIFGVNRLSEWAELEEIALAILSPGVPLSSPLVEDLRNNEVPLISEFELGIALLRRPTIVVTGSNGKSTTASLIKHILIESGIEAFLCGNVGTPVIAGVTDLEYQEHALSSQGWVVAEASSYQLESCKILKPDIAVVLNITENHLERHGTFENYLAAKMNLFARMDAEGIAIFPASDPLITSQLEGLRVTRMPVIFDEELRWQSVNDGGSCHNVALIKTKTIQYEQVVVSSSKGDITIELSDLNLIGSHNRLNAAFAVGAALMAGADSAKIPSALRTFSALEHRLRRVPDVKEFWINDSKSTTVAATVAAVNSTLVDFPQQKLTLLVGGQLKIGSWAHLTELINLNSSKILSIIVFGGDREKIRALLSDVECKVLLAERVIDAINLAIPSAKLGDVVLFSPGALSFDEFRSFSERGEAFESWVREVAG